MIKFPSIPRLENYLSDTMHIVIYPKMDGTNTSVEAKFATTTFDEDTHIHCYSRNNVLLSDTELYGFKKFVSNLSMEGVFENIYRVLEERGIDDGCKISRIRIFGEFMGEGIQKGMAINKIGKRVWGIFEIGVGYYDSNLNVESDMVFYDIQYFENELSNFIQESPEETVYTLSPLYVSSPSQSVSLVNIESIGYQHGMIATNTCPFTLKHFGIKGKGEGVVIKQINNNTGTIIKRWKVKDINILDGFKVVRRSDIISTSRNQILFLFRDEDMDGYLNDYYESNPNRNIMSKQIIREFTKYISKMYDKIVIDCDDTLSKSYSRDMETVKKITKNEIRKHVSTYIEKKRNKTQ